MNAPDYNGVFVTGTDTGIGKTFCSLLLMQALQQRGLRVAGMKPVASGGMYKQQQLVNDDALRLQQQSDLQHPYELVNPYVFEPPIAPHIAARQAGQIIEPKKIQHAFQQLRATTDQVVVEGVGGWRVPLSDSLSVSDLPILLDLPVILIVGMKLGCLNHALLTIESIKQHGVKLLGWIANSIDPDFEQQQANLHTLKSHINAPCLAHIPFFSASMNLEQRQQSATNINISWL